MYCLDPRLGECLASDQILGKSLATHSVRPVYGSRSIKAQQQSQIGSKICSTPSGTPVLIAVDKLAGIENSDHQLILTESSLRAAGRPIRCVQQDFVTSGFVAAVSHHV